MCGGGIQEPDHSKKWIGGKRGWHVEEAIPFHFPPAAFQWQENEGDWSIYMPPLLSLEHGAGSQLRPLEPLYFSIIGYFMVFRYINLYNVLACNYSVYVHGQLQFLIHIHAELPALMFREGALLLNASLQCSPRNKALPKAM